MARKLKWLCALHLAWLPALVLAWLMIAGESGSPVPDNWPVLERILHIIEVSALASLLLLPLAPASLIAAARGSRWAVAYPFVLLLGCGGTVALCLRELGRVPPVPTAPTAPTAPAFIAPPYHPCWRFGRNIPPVDAVGKPIRHGDLVVIRSGPGSSGPIPDTPEQAVERKAWDGRIVVVTGLVQGGALQFQPPGADTAHEAPRFCLWPDNVVHARLH